MSITNPHLTSFTLNLGSCTLTIADIWPDGDAPKNPTAQDVVDLIDDSGGASHVVRDWALLDGIQITGNGTAHAR